MGRSRFVKISLLMLMDCLFMVLSWVGAVAIYTYMFRLRGTMIVILISYTYILFAINIMVFTIFGVYRNMWLYAGITDMMRITLASAMSNFIIYVIYRIISGYWQSPAIAVLAFFFLLVMSGGVRFMPRIKRELARYFKKDSANATRVLVIGAGESAALLLKELRTGNRPYTIVGIVDDDIKKQGMKLYGTKVLGSIDMVVKIVDRLQVDEILIAIPSATNEQITRIISCCPINKCKVRLINSINESAQGVSGLRTPNIIDLLGREETKLNISEISKMIANESIMVTGGGGSIGSELVRQLMNFNFKSLVIFDMYENNAYNLLQELKLNYPQKANTIFVRIGNIQDIPRLERVFNEFKPAVVFHAAAYKHVPLMEECPELAIKNNVFGTANTAAMSLKYGARKFVMISTDKAVNPTNVMGASKRLAERVVLSMNGVTSGEVTIGKKLRGLKPSTTEFVCVRFGNVLGSNGSVIPIFQRQIEAGGPITVTHPEMTRFFMTIPEAARLVLQAACMAKGGEIYILDMGEPIKIMDLAKTMIRMSGKVPDVDIKIEIIGLRPGEKLYEEILIDEKSAKKTDNGRIYVANPEPDSKEKINFIFDELKKSEHEGNMKEKITQLEPTFKPTEQNSDECLKYII